MKKLSNYTAVFKKNKTRDYTMTVPSLPGLVTEGRNLQEAEEMAIDAKAGEDPLTEREVANIKLAVSV